MTEHRLFFRCIAALLTGMALAGCQHTAVRLSGHFDHGGIIILKSLKHLLDFFLIVFGRSLHTPAYEYIVSIVMMMLMLIVVMMMVLMVMLIMVMVMMLMLMVMIVIVLIMVMMMVFMFVIVLIMVMVMMLMLMIVLIVVMVVIMLVSAVNCVTLFICVLL